MSRDSPQTVPETLPRHTDPKTPLCVLCLLAFFSLIHSECCHLICSKHLHFVSPLDYIAEDSFGEVDLVLWPNHTVTRSKKDLRDH